jgi:hypothetical protein
MRWTRLLALGAVGVVVALVALFGVAHTALAQDTQCVEQSYGGNTVCTANDFGVKEIRIIDVANGCTQDPVGVFTATVEVWMFANTPSRYNVGYYINTQGGNAETAVDECYHNFLYAPLSTTPILIDYDNDGVSNEIYRNLTGVYPDPPFPAGYGGAWYDQDLNPCGDMMGTGQISIETIVLSAVCQSNNPGGEGNDPAAPTVDVHSCGSWNNNQNAVCNGLADAVPGTPSKCSCGYIELPFEPTAIELASFSAEAQGGDVLLTWETATELDNLGFNLYRADSLYGERSQINGRLIPSEMSGNAMGATYTYLDETAAPGQTSYYWLEDVDVHGLAGEHGPAEATTAAQKTLPGRPRPLPIPAFLSVVASLVIWAVTRL